MITEQGLLQSASKEFQSDLGPERERERSGLMMVVSCREQDRKGENGGWGWGFLCISYSHRVEQDEKSETSQ